MGDPVCWLDEVCPRCGAFLGEVAIDAPCPRCGAEPAEQASSPEDARPDVPIDILARTSADDGRAGRDDDG